MYVESDVLDRCILFSIILNENMELNNNLIKHQKARPDVKLLNIKKNYLAIIVSAAAAVGCYVNSLNGEFVHDDIFAIKSNPDVTGKTPIYRLFYNDFWGKSMTDKTSHKSYRPLCVLTFRLNYWLGGGDSFWFHVVNILLHALVTCMFTYVCQSVLFLPQNLCLMAGLMFAVHPVHTEAVSGIVGRADVLAALFFMLSFTLYVKCLDVRWTWQNDVPRTRHPVLFAASLCCAGVAMLCKEHGIMVLPVCAAYDVLVCCRRGLLKYLLSKEEHKRYVPVLTRMTVVVMVFSGLVLFRISMLHGHIPEFQVSDNPASFAPHFLTRCLTYSYVWMFNVWLLLAPSTLCYDWQVGSIPLVENLHDPRNLMTLVFFAVLCALIIHWCVNFMKFTVEPDVVLPSVLFMMLPFLPASNLFFRVGFVLAERILYIPSTGLCILVPYGACHLLNRRRRSSLNWIVQVSFCVLLLLYVWKSHTQNLKWRSRQALFRSGITSMPNNAKVHYNYANYLKDVGDRDTAVLHYRIALSLFQDDASSHNNLGTLLGNQTEAETHFRKALQLRPNHRGAQVNLGSLIFKKGDQEAGMLLLRNVLEQHPDYIEAQVVMAGMLAETGNFNAAEELYSTASRQSPNSAYITHLYAACLQQKGDIREAVRLYEKAYKKDPKHTVSVVSAAKGLHVLGEFSQAESLLKQARVKDVMILDQLGMLYGQTGRTEEAVKTYQDILRQSPNNTDVLMHYANILMHLKNYRQGEQMMHRALQVSPNDIDVLLRMSKLLGLQGKHQDALQYLDHAINVSKRTQNKERLSDLLYQQGHHQKDLHLYREAVKSFERSLAVNHNRTVVYVNLGALHHLLGEFKKARYYYNAVLTREPDNEIARTNLLKLEVVASRPSKRTVGSS